MKMIISTKQTLNNDIVLMRHLIRQVKVHIIHKLTRNVKNLRRKKGDESVKQKFEKKAERLVEEILALKKYNNDLISKDIILETRGANIILSDINSNAKDRILAKVMTFNKVSEKIKEIREKYSETLIIEFLKSSKTRNKKGKKINKTNQKTSENNENTKKKEVDEGILNKSKKRRVEFEESENGDENVLNKPKKKKQKKDEQNVESEKKQKMRHESSKKKIKQKKIESDEDVSKVEIKENGKSEVSEENVESEKKQTMRDEKSKKKKKKKEIESDEDVSKEKIKENGKSEVSEESADTFFLLSNQQEEENDVTVSHKLIRKERKEKKQKNKSKILNENVDSFFSNENDKDEQTLSNKSKRKKETEKIQTKKGACSDEIKIHKKSKRNDKLKIVEESVDPFFLMSNGQDEYLSIVKSTSDESTVKQINRTYTDNLNRKQRRQLQKNGGKAPKRQQFSDKISTNRSSFMNIGPIHKLPKENSKPSNIRTHSITDEVQNLHPSWQAKLVQKPSVVQFQGKKIVFDEA